MRPAIDYDLLDPWTLRWVADEHVADAMLLETYLARPLPSDTPQGLARMRNQAHGRRSEARRLRSLATRVERHREKGGAT